MEDSYKEVVLNKLKIISMNSDLEFIPKTSEEHKVYEYESKSIGWYYDLKEAKEALDKYSETESKVIAYEIVGPEHGYEESDLNIDWDNISNDEDNDLVSDESPQFHFLYDKNKNLISSYFYDKENPGGKRLEGEKEFKKGDISYVRDSV